MVRERPDLRQLVRRRLVPLAVAMFALTGLIWWLAGRPAEPIENRAVLRVLTYSSFSNSWGPGPEIASLFEKEFGERVEYRDAGDAGLLLNQMSLLPADVVLGLDRFAIEQARTEKKWRPLPKLSDEKSQALHQEPEFVAFDWSPMAFVYRKGEIEPPRSLDDLLSPRFQGTIALEDPRTSSPGLQFLNWLIAEKGEEAAFVFLEALKPQIHSVSPSWSTAYGMFTEKRAKLVFSYVTSPIYHATQDQDDSYAAALFDSGHPSQIEYAGVPETCVNCAGAEAFVRFLLRPEIQAILMQKNYMLPVVTGIEKGTAFEAIPEVKPVEVAAPNHSKADAQRLFERWRKLGL